MCVNYGTLSKPSSGALTISLKQFTVIKMTFPIISLLLGSFRFAVYVLYISFQAVFSLKKDNAKESKFVSVHAIITFQRKYHILITSVKVLSKTLKSRGNTEMKKKQG